MRTITIKIEDIGKLTSETHKEVCALLKDKGQAFDGVLISTNTGIAYAWKEAEDPITNRGGYTS